MNAFCDQMSSHLASELKLEVENGGFVEFITSVGTRIAGAAGAAGSAGVGMFKEGMFPDFVKTYITSNVAVGGAAVSGVAVAGAAVAGGVAVAGVAYLAYRWLRDPIDLKNYKQALDFIIGMLLKPKTDPIVAQKVRDYRQQEEVYYLEKALLLLYVSDRRLENFKSTKVDGCTLASKLSLLNWLEGIKIIHEIRDLLASQCFIALVGTQNAG